MSTIKFPKELLFGVSTSSYQIEGACNEDGRGVSIWDTYSKTLGNVLNNDNGDIACDSYHRIDEDIRLLKELGVQTYRFSIAWPRIFPNNMTEVNPKGIAYYHKVIDQLLANDIVPMVTIYHWDLPQYLQDIGGWRNREVTDYFATYADLLFAEYGEKVPYWLTVNEPWCAAFLGYYSGEQAPGEKSLQGGLDAAHYLMLAHGKAVQKFRERQLPGKIGYAPNYMWYEPYSNRSEDIEACRRSTAWFLEWFSDPIFKGSYPEFLVSWFAEKGVKPPVESGDLKIISEPIDILGINFYTGSVARYKKDQGLFDTEQIDIDFDYNDIGMKIFPEGFYKILLAVKEKYGDIPIFITENGAAISDVMENGKVHDPRRIQYLMQHLTELNRAMASGVNVQSYCCWSLMDNFEWSFGYSQKFGLVHVDFDTLTRTPKDSFYWYQNIVKTHQFEIPDHETRV